MESHLIDCVKTRQWASCPLMKVAGSAAKSIKLYVKKTMESGWELADERTATRTVEAVIARGKFVIGVDDNKMNKIISVASITLCTDLRNGRVKCLLSLDLILLRF